MKIHDKIQSRMIKERANFYSFCKAVYFGKKEIYLYEVQDLFINKFTKLINNISNLFKLQLFLSNSIILFKRIFNVLLPIIIFSNQDLSLASKLALLIYMYFFSALVGQISAIMKTVSILKSIIDQLAIPVSTETDIINTDSGFAKSNAKKYQPSFLRIPEGKIPYTNNSVDTKEILYGHKYVLCGEIGTGKTTLLRMIMGFENKYNERDRKSSINPVNQDRIYYVTQDTYILNANLRENCCLGINHGSVYFEYIKKYQLEHFEELGELPIENLSGGEKKRISFVRFFT